jgi:hypothetical protein
VEGLPIEAVIVTHQDARMLAATPMSSPPRAAPR